MGLFERSPQGLDLLPMLLLEVGDLAGQGHDDRVVGFCGGWLGSSRSGLSAQDFDPAAKLGVSVEERVGDSGLTLDGLEGDGFTAFDECADGLFGGFRLGLGLGFRSGGQGGDASIASGHG